MNDISVIIVNYKGGERLNRCLESLQMIDDNRFTFEVIVVDNQSNDGSMSKLPLQFPQFIFLSNSGNHGFSNGCNLGASVSNGNYLLFLNPDTSVTADALNNILEEVRVRPEFSILSCSQVRENGSKERPYGKFLNIFNLTGWQRSVQQIFFGRIENSFPQTKNYIYPDWVSGSVVMISKKSFYSLGKWDDDYWMYFEDVDLCRRARQHNGEIVKLRSTAIVHAHGGSSRANIEVTAITKTEVHISRHLYISKHEHSGKAFWMHTLLILDNMVLGSVSALLGMLFFPVRKIHVYSNIYVKLAEYYLQALKSGEWISVRSVNYDLYNRDSIIHAVASGIKWIVLLTTSMGDIVCP